MKKQYLILILAVIIIAYFLLKKTTTSVSSTIAGKPTSVTPTVTTSSPLTNFTSGIANTLKGLFSLGTTVAAGASNGSNIGSIVKGSTAVVGATKQQPFTGAMQPTLAQLQGDQLPLTQGATSSVYGNDYLDPLTDPTLGDLPLSSSLGLSLDTLPSYVAVDPSVLDSSIFDYSGVDPTLSESVYG